MSDVLNEREENILSILSTQGSVTVTNLSKSLDVSEVTIRSDLSRLEEGGLLVRTHGGAVPAIHPHIFQRNTLNIDQKNAIAKKVASTINDGDTIMIEAGTTTGLIPRYLVGKKNIHVITNSNQVFATARTNPDLKITLVGGEYRNNTDSFVGAIAQETLQKFNVTHAFVGTDGFSVQAGITTHLVEGGEIIKIMRQKAKNLVLLADSSKFDKTGVVTILPLTEVDIVYTDSGLCNNDIENLNEFGLQTIICD